MNIYILEIKTIFHWFFVNITYYSFRDTPIKPQFPGAELHLTVTDLFGYGFDYATIQDTVITPMTDWVGEYTGLAVLGDSNYIVFTDLEQSGNSDIYFDKYEIPAMCGDANYDSRVNVSDAVYLINYVFSGGDEPDPVLACGDANDDSTVNVSDAVFLINFVFSGGKPAG